MIERTPAHRNVTIMNHAAAFNGWERETEHVKSLLGTPSSATGLLGDAIRQPVAVHHSRPES